MGPRIIKNFFFLEKRINKNQRIFTKLINKNYQIGQTLSNFNKTNCHHNNTYLPPHPHPQQVFQGLPIVYMLFLFHFLILYLSPGLLMRVVFTTEIYIENVPVPPSRDEWIICSIFHCWDVQTTFLKLYQYLLSDCQNWWKKLSILVKGLSVLG